jgi:hypothetical protein
MRTLIVSLVVLLTLAGRGSAAVFDCSGVTLPSSIVICSDPDLTRLAGERQEIYQETLSRLRPEQRARLWEDQKAWVRSYASACGVPPDSLPPIPVPSSVIECFKRAAEARAVYLRSYNPASPQSSAIATTGKEAYLREVPLQQKNGIYVIPVQINGAITLPFVLDSGASDVQIPSDVFSTLVRANTILPTDLTGGRTYILADGSTKDEHDLLSVN